MPQNTIQPVFYDPAIAMQGVMSALGKDKYAERTVKRDRNHNDPEEYLRLWDRRTRDEESHTRKLNEMFVTMHRRFRGVTISDQFGYFGTRPETAGRWIDYAPDQDGEVHPINIVRPDIKSNVAALLQANVAIDVEPAMQSSADRKQNAERIQYLVDFFERDTWDEATRALIFDGIQKEGTWLLESFLDRRRGSRQPVVMPVENMQHYGAFECLGCNTHTVKELPPDDPLIGQGVGEAACPQCHNPAKVIVKSLKNYDIQEQEHQTGEISHRAWSGFNFIIDRKGARGGGIQTANWLVIMELVDRAELEDEYPQFEFSSPFEWSYSLKCQNALAEADWSILYSGWQYAKNSNEWDVFQKNRIYLHEEAYRNYVAPSDWEFRGKNGKCKFRIKRGETWKEAVRNSFGRGVEGFCCVFVNEQLIDIETPPDREPNFRKCFSDVHFQRDSGSYHSLPHWDSVQMQDDITLFNTLKTETAARNSVDPTWFNSEVFDINDFSWDYIPSKNGALDQSIDIRSQVFKPPTAKSADQITDHLIFMLRLHDKYSDRTPAMRGEVQPGTAYAAQRQQLEQSYGMLTPAAKSFAQMKVTSTKQKIRLAFEHWTVEQFQAVAARHGEQWSEVDVQSLVRTDLERDVAINYVTGSEIPQGNMTKELKFFNGLREAQPYIQAGAVKPDIVLQILKRIDEFADFDFDLSGAETSDSLAQKRYAALVTACEEYKALPWRDLAAMKEAVVSYQPPDEQTAAAALQQTAMATASNEPGAEEALQQAQAALRGTPVTAFDALSEEIMLTADIYFSPAEDVDSQLAFFVPEIMRELAKPAPNYTLVEMMQILVEQFKEQRQAAEANVMMSDPSIQMRQQEMLQAQAQAETVVAKDVELEKAKADEGHERELEKMAVAEASKENQREFEREKAAQDHLLKQEAAASAVQTSQ